MYIYLCFMASEWLSRLVLHYHHGGYIHMLHCSGKVLSDLCACTVCSNTCNGSCFRFQF